jgi:hypothetical protein
MAFFAAPAVAQAPDSDADGVPDSQDRCNNGGDSGQAIRQAENGCPDFFSITTVQKEIRWLAGGNFKPYLNCEPVACNAKGSLTVSKRDQKALGLRSRRIGVGTERQGPQDTFGGGLQFDSQIEFKIPKTARAAIKKRKTLSAVLALEVDVPQTDRANAVTFAFKEKIAFRRVPRYRNGTPNCLEHIQRFLFSADNAVFIQQSFEFNKVSGLPGNRCHDFATWASAWHGAVR